MRCLFILLNALLIAYLIFVPKYYLSAGFMVLVFIAQAVDLVRYSSRISKKISTVFSSIRNEDFALHFNDSDDSDGLQGFHTEVNALISTFRKVKIEKEQQYRFLHHIVDFLFTGILSYTQDGKLHLFNREAMEILDCPAFSRLDVFEKRFPEFGAEIASLKNKEQKLIEIDPGKGNLKLSIYKDQMWIGDEEHTVLSFQNITNAVEKKELEAYQRLIRILTHEIMNSVTPMISISDTLRSLAESYEQIDGEQKKDLEKGLATIHERSKGILKFTEDYRNLISIPSPRMDKVNIKGLLEESLSVFEEEISSREMGVSIEGPPNIYLELDSTQMKQVFINLIKNAIQAMSGIESPQLKIKILRFGNNTEISFIDNGEGISTGQMSKIFVPFYSTKADGSGIGLSLSRAIVHAHGGRMTVKSEAGNTVVKVEV